MKCFSINCTRLQYAVVLAWCRQSEIQPYDLMESGEYSPMEVNKLIDWFSTSPGPTKVGFHIHVADETEYMLLALRWPQYHLQVSPSS